MADKGALDKHSVTHIRQSLWVGDILGLQKATVAESARLLKECVLRCLLTQCREALFGLRLARVYRCLRKAPALSSEPCAVAIGREGDPMLQYQMLVLCHANDRLANMA